MSSLNRRERRLAKSLIRRFDRASKRGKLPKTLASASYMRKHRIRIVGQLWELYETEIREGGRATTFHILPRNWVFSSASLLTIDAKKLLEVFRRDLTRFGKLPEDGWLFAGIHGEFDENTETFHLHLHGAAAGSMIDRIDKLRRRPKYRQPKRRPHDTKKRVSVKVTRKALRDPMKALSYTLQSWWPVKSFTRPGAREMTRKLRRSRIPGHHHTRSLLWLDAHRLQDVTLQMSLQVKAGRLLRVGKAYRNKKREPR